MTEQIRSVDMTPAELDAFDTQADNAIGQLGRMSTSQANWVTTVRSNIERAGLAHIWAITDSGDVRRVNDANAVREGLPIHASLVEEETK